MTTPDEWRWSDERGVQRRVSGAELREALANGLLATTTLVWRRGMPEWTPALEVPELSAAIVSAKNDGEPDTITEATLTEPGREIREIFEAAGIPAPVAKRRPAGGAGATAPEQRAAAGPREPMRTLVGLDGKRGAAGGAGGSPGEGQGSRAGASSPPIVVPAAGGTPEPGVARAITRPPRFGAPDEGRGTAAIPRAPKLPGPLDADGAAAPGATARASAAAEKPAGEKLAAERPAAERPAAGAAAPRRPTIGAPWRKPGGATEQPAAGGRESGGAAQDAVTRAAEILPAAPAPQRPARGSVPPPPRHIGRNLPPPPKPVEPAEPAAQPARARPATRSVPPPPVAVRAPSLPLKTPEPPNGHAAEPFAAAAAPAPDPATRTPLPFDRASQPPPETPADADAARRAAIQSQTLASPLFPVTSAAPETPVVPIAAAPPPMPSPIAAAPPRASAPPPMPSPIAAPLQRASTPPPRAVADADPPLTTRLPDISPSAPEPAPESWTSVMRSGGSVLRAHVRVPVSSLVSSGGALILLVVLAFFAGRCSVVDGERAVVAQAGVDAAILRSRSALPSPPRPCYVARQPKQWAPLVAKSIPFDVAPFGAASLAIGYARTPSEAVGLEVDLAKAAVSEGFTSAAQGTLARVFPTPSAPEKFVTTLEAQGAIGSAVHVPGPSPLVVGLADGALVAAERAGAAPTRLWPAPGGGDQDALRVVGAGAQGYALTLRQGGAVWGGWISAARAPIGELGRISGSGGALGKPSLGWNGREIAVVFADRPAGSSTWQIRLGKAPPGKVPGETLVLPLPDGGPGGDAFAPDIAGLDDGRWLIVWTEGPPGRRAMRAQTLAADLTPIGDPIALSPPAGNFGQGILGVAGSYVGAVFLSKPAATYELWGVVLQCG